MAGRAGRPRRLGIPYTRVVRGNRFFEPTPAMRRAGFRPLALGPDDESARRRAWSLYEKWDAIRQGPSELRHIKRSREDDCAARRYPPGSIGEAWQKWVRSEEWRRLAASTRNKVWWEAWNKRIAPVFADCAPDAVTMDDLSAWRAKIVQASGLDPAHKALKVWRSFWRKMVAMRYTALSDPSLGIVNTAPPPRDARFSHGEAMRLAKAAWRAGYRGLACIIVTAWDTGFAPVDCRTLRQKHIETDPVSGRRLFNRSAEGRQKTGVAVIGTLSPFGDFLVRTYLERFGAGLTAEAFLFRMRAGGPYGESRLGADFAAVRAIAMPGDKRQLRDMRRSGVVEAFTGEAGAEGVAQKFGNTISRSNQLFRTYNPVDLEQVRAVDEKRLAGRRRRNKG